MPPIVGISGRDKVIGQNIRNFRLAAAMTQKELAKKLRISYQQLQKYEDGKNRISAATLEMLANALRVPVDKFFGDYGDHEVNKNNSLKLLRLYHQIPSEKLKKLLLASAKTFVDHCEKQPPKTKDIT